MKITNTGFGILGSRLLRRPFYGRVHITYRCNYRCQMCDICSNRPDFEELPVGALAIVAARLWALGARHAVLTGGEPFLRRDLPEIVGAFSERGFSVRIQTNGGPQVTETVLEEAARAGLRDISVSIDTLDAALQDRICGARDVVRHALRTLDLSRMLLPGGMSLANVVASPYNFRELPDLVRFFGRRGVYTYVTPVVVRASGQPKGADYLARGEDSSFGFGSVAPEERDRVIDALVTLRRGGHGLVNSIRHLEDFREFLRTGSPRWACSAGRLALDVRPDGRVSICKEKAPIANILSPAFFDEYCAPAARQVAEVQRTGCAGCFYAEYREPHYAVRDAGVLLEWTRDWFRTFRKGMQWRGPDTRQ